MPSIASDDLDRVGPTRRPHAPVRGYQRWRSLLFLHWEVEPELLRQLVPDELELDTFAGQAYVGLVPFAMEGVRPSWAPEPLGFDFLETNLRTYVHVDGQQPGVYFFSLDAANLLAVSVARAIWSLPYFDAEMTLHNDGKQVHYSLKRAHAPFPKLRVSYEIGAELPRPSPGSFEFWLVERYLLHTMRRGVLYTGQVHHTPYPLHEASLTSFYDEIVNSAGFEVEGPPPIVHYSPGVDVEIFDLAPNPRTNAQGSR